MCAGCRQLGECGTTAGFYDRQAPSPVVADARRCVLLLWGFWGLGGWVCNWQASWLLSPLVAGGLKERELMTQLQSCHCYFLCNWLLLVWSLLVKTKLAAIETYQYIYYIRLCWETHTVWKVTKTFSSQPTFLSDQGSNKTLGSIRLFCGSAKGFN